MNKASKYMLNNLLSKLIQTETDMVTMDNRTKIMTIDQFNNFKM